MNSRRRVFLLGTIAYVCYILLTVEAVDPTPNSVKIVNKQLQVDGVQFPVRGIAYSPVPVGENVNIAPFGDYFTPDYAYIWKRDFASIKSMGINTLRIYSWSTSVDHTPFLDTCHRAGLKVIITHYLGTSTSTPVGTPEQRQAAVDAFSAHVQTYGDHPAVLMWSIGNEVNGPWLEFKTAFNDVGSCAWTRSCENNVDPNSACFKALTCVYNGLFKWINDIATAGKQHTTRPMTSALADIDQLIGTNPKVDRIPLFEPLLTSLDVMTIQLYRGHSFGNYFQQFAAESKLPLLVGEFGVDAYNDPCGWPENFQIQPCNNAVNNGQGGSDVTSNFVGCTGQGADCKSPGVTTQATWDRDLANEIFSSGVAIGGVLVSWHDENWKGVGTEDHCTTPCQFADIQKCFNDRAYTMGGSAGCTYKAHITCSNYDTQTHDLCGYFLGSAPDRYVNEEWFGVNAVSDCGVFDATGHRLSAITPRLVVQAFAELFGAPGGVQPQTCESLKPCWQCTRDHSVADITSGTCNSQCGLEFTTTETPPDNTPDGTPDDGDTGGDTNHPVGTGGNNNGNGKSAASTVQLEYMTLIACILVTLLFTYSHL